MSDKGEIVTLRLDPVTRDLVDALANPYGINRSAALRQAVRRWALAEGMEIPTTVGPEQGKAAA